MPFSSLHYSSHSVFNNNSQHTIFRSFSHAAIVTFTHWKEQNIRTKYIAAWVIKKLQDPRRNVFNCKHAQKRSCYCQCTILGAVINLVSMGVATCLLQLKLCQSTEDTGCSSRKCNLSISTPVFPLSRIGE